MRGSSTSGEHSALTSVYPTADNRRAIQTMETTATHPTNADEVDDAATVCGVSVVHPDGKSDSSGEAR